MELTILVLLARLSAGAVWYVDADAVGPDNGTSWTNAYKDLQSALSAAASGDEIWVAEGTYKSTGGTDRTISFQLKAGVAVYGGFAGNRIVRIGAYGNMDSRGPESPVPEPEIAFGWPIAVECAGGRVFVADLVNRRVVAVSLKHAIEEIVAVR